MQASRPEELPVARGPDGSVLLTEPPPGCVATCFGCGETLAWRREHTRSRRRPDRTVTFSVRGHFFHSSASVGRALCSSESALHAAAKAWLVSAPAPVRFRFCCPECSSTAVLDLPEGDRIAERRHAEPDGSSIRPDVTVLDRTTGAVLAVVEVWKTHACDDAKLASLERLAPRRWFEVRADAVLESARFPAPIPIAVCGSGVCTACTERAAADRMNKAAKIHSLREEIAKLKSQKDELDRELSELGNHRREEVNEELRMRLRAQSVQSVDGIIETGPYRGVSISVLADNDRDYVLWIARGLSDERSSVVRRARELTAGLCKVCGEETEIESDLMCPICCRLCPDFR